MTRAELTPEEISRLVTHERVNADEIADYLGIGKIHAKRRIADAMLANNQPRPITAFARWAGRFSVVTWQMVAEEFQVSRATAYRYLADLRAFRRFQST